MAQKSLDLGLRAVPGTVRGELTYRHKLGLPVSLYGSAFVERSRNRALDYGVAAGLHVEF